MRTRLDIVGCRHVADSYAARPQLHRDALTAHAIYDRQPERQARFCQHRRFTAAESLDDLLGDPGIDVVVNPTGPHSHETVTEAALTASRHA